MDPNALLDQMREYARLAAEGEDVRRNERELRWAFRDLDAWLKSGGFPPKDWQH